MQTVLSKLSMLLPLKSFIFIFSIVAVLSSAFGQTKAKIYITMISHNEENNIYSSTYYQGQRNAIIQFANLFSQKKVTWNFESDWTFLEAVGNYDTGSVMSNTNNKNILRWLYEDMGVEIDPHGHESKYMYADLAQMIENLGVPSSKIVGGFLYEQNPVQFWEQHEDGTYSADSQYFFKPDYLWGAATYNHQGADDKTYGIWKPLDVQDFYAHDSTKHLAYIGRGCDDKVEDTFIDISGTLELMNALNTGLLPEAGFYNAAIMFRQQYFLSGIFFNNVSKAIDSLIQADTQGRLAWTNLSKAGDIWKTNFNMQPYQLSCDSLFNLQPVVTTIHEYDDADFNSIISIYPNPALNDINISLNNLRDGIYSLEMYDPLGKKQITKAFDTENAQGGIHLNLQNMIAGSYTICVYDCERHLVSKQLLIKQ